MAANQCLICLLLGKKEDDRCREKSQHHPFPQRYFGNNGENKFTISFGAKHHVDIEKAIRTTEKKILSEQRDAERKIKILGSSDELEQIINQEFDFDFFYNFMTNYIGQIVSEKSPKERRAIRKRLKIAYNINVGLDKERPAQEYGKAILNALILEAKEHCYNWQTNDDKARFSIVIFKEYMRKEYAKTKEINLNKQLPKKESDYVNRDRRMVLQT